MRGIDKVLNLALLLAALTFPARLAADDEEAIRLYSEGRKAYLAADYYRAGNLFVEAGEKAKSIAPKANSLLAESSAWKMCGLYYREFKAIEKLLREYPEFADFGASVEREFEIGDLFHQGAREPSFWALRWIPWLVEGDHAIEVFEKALAHAPFSAAAPRARLRLAFLYAEDGKRIKAIEELRCLVRDYPQAPERPYALLALADELMEMARRGDGDGRYINEAGETLERFRREFPNAPEISWVGIKMLEIKDIQAERLHGMAEFYRKNGREETAERYLAQVLRDFPESLPAVESEKELSQLSSDFVPGVVTANPAARLPEYKVYKVPEEARHVLLTPGENGNHYLVPVPDILSDSTAPGGKK